MPFVGELGFPPQTFLVLSRTVPTSSADALAFAVLPMRECSPLYDITVTGPSATLCGRGLLTALCNNQPCQ